MTQFYIGKEKVSRETYAAHLAKHGIVLKTTLFQKATNLAKAGRRVAKAIATGERVMVSEEEQERRMVICEACEFFSGVTCRKCGCFIRFKSRLQTEHCPIDKW